VVKITDFLENSAEIPADTVPLHNAPSKGVRLIVRDSKLHVIFLGRTLSKAMDRSETKERVNAC